MPGSVPGARNCAECRASFVIDADDVAFYERMRVPVPALCPPCRMKRKLAWRNECTLYKRVCGLCGKSTVTMYHPRAPYTVYCNDCWFSDQWDPASYAMAYDPARPFFDQLLELTRRVPKCALYITATVGENVNSDYTNFASGNKNCYLIFNSGPGNENCAYGRGLLGARDVFDTYFADNNERVYEGVSVQKNAGVAWAQNTNDCLDSWFLLDCSGCHHCFGSVNLRHGAYQFFGEQLSKEEWERRVGEIIGSHERMEAARQRFEEYAKQFPRRAHENFRAVDSTGNYIIDSKNCHDCYEVSFSEDLRHAFSMKQARTCFDMVGHGRKGEFLLECAGVGYASQCIGDWWAENVHDVDYSIATRASQYCIGCDGMKNGTYCILNKRYEKEEYKAVRARIVEELTGKGLYGLFFPPALALFSYNETLAQENFPLAKEQALAEGFRWEDDIPQTRGQETMRPEEIPDHINDVQDSILDRVLACSDCGRNYRLIRPELEFYRRILIPIPRRCFNCRYLDRIRRRGPLALFDGTCGKCGMAVRTSHPPADRGVIYCESCYQQAFA